jgi:hypothetical protein
MKQNKTMSFELEIAEHLKLQPNASQYIEDLVYADMAKNKKKSDKPLDMTELHSAVIVDAEALIKKEEIKKAHSAAWDLLELEVKEEIKDMPDWGVKWHTIFYPMYEQKGSLTLKEVRDWYFANKEGFKL